MKRYNINKIPRFTDIPTHFRPKNEEEYASTMGKHPHTSGSWYKNIYDFYQSNEV